MLSVYLSQSPFSPPKSSKPTLSTYKLFRDVTAISHSSSTKLLPLVSKRSDLAPLNPADDVASGDPPPAGALLRHKKRPRSFLTPRLEANGEKNPKEEGKRELSASKEKKNKSTGDSEIDFLRYNSSSDNADVAGELQVSIVCYKNRFCGFLNPKIQVDLVSAVHIGDKTYFNTLQEKLSFYDCVLYEGISHKSEKSYSINGFIQRSVGKILSMDFQLDCLNYKGRNWYNADLDFETLSRLQEERGENMFSMARDRVGSALKSYSDSTTTQFDSIKSKLLKVSYLVPMPLALTLLINFTCSPPENTNENNNNNNEDENENDDFTPDFREFVEFLELELRSGLKVVLARALTSTFAQEMNMENEENSVIIGERNKAALEELKRVIKRGERKIAILYGAGHMPDLGKRLMQDFNLVPCEINWVTAWEIKRPKNRYFGPIYEKYVGKYLPFGERNLGVWLLGLGFSGFVLFDLWVWWTAINWAGFEMVKLVQALIIV
ncbi:hypothetical protein LUZ60_013606 [Juncus effusus]|nr:hypothetical protein LUZ60_013606 [Juncus effusus]